MSLVPLYSPRCDVCEHPLGSRNYCANPVCTWSDRYFDRIWAIAADSGELAQLLRRHKAGSAPDAELTRKLGYLLAAYIETRPELLLFDLIAATPAFVAAGVGRGWDHIAALVSVAAGVLPRLWEFADGATIHPPVVQVAPTAKFSTQHDWRNRRTLAEGPFRRALHVPDPSRVRGQSILVVDDIFTEGLRTREVARALHNAGARRVCGLVYARHVFADRR